MQLSHFESHLSNSYPKMTLFCGNMRVLTNRLKLLRSVFKEWMEAEEAQGEEVRNSESTLGIDKACTKRI